MAREALGDDSTGHADSVSLDAGDGAMRVAFDASVHGHVEVSG